MPCATWSWVVVPPPPPSMLSYLKSSWPGSALRSAGVPACGGCTRSSPVGVSATTGERRTHELAREVDVLERDAMRELVLVGGAAVPAFDVLVVEIVVAELCHARSRLARVRGVHPVVARRGVEEHRRVRHAGPQVLVRRPARHVLPVLGGRVAVFRDPRGAGTELRVALHVEQRH